VRVGSLAYTKATETYIDSRWQHCFSLVLGNAKVRDNPALQPSLEGDNPEETTVVRAWGFPLCRLEFHRLTESVDWEVSAYKTSLAGEIV
jgi:hypothetical protein